MEQQTTRSCSQEEPDYADSLEPGYRFCPTDSELIVHFLKRKIETGRHPKCRLYEINLYDHNPQQLSERYLSHENKWYFLTARERKYPRGSRPSRNTKNFGRWVTTQKYTTVYNEMREAVGSKRSLVYYDDKGIKTIWRMHEYTTNDPNLPIGSNGNKLSDCVLCNVYKKEKILTKKNNQSEQVQNRWDQEKNQLNDEPQTKRQRISAGRQPSGHDQHIQNSTTDVVVATPARLMSTPYQKPVDGCCQPFPPQNFPQPTDNINWCGQPFLPQALQQPLDNIMHMSSCQAMEALAQHYAPYPPTSTERLDYPTDPALTWANTNYEDLPASIDLDRRPA